MDPRLLSFKESRGYYHRPCSLGEFNSHYIGGVTHELGHAFGLPHACQRHDDLQRGIALMGAGNHPYGNEHRGEGRGTCLTEASAMLLAYSRPFAGNVKGARQRSRWCNPVRRAKSALHEQALQRSLPRTVTLGRQAGMVVCCRSGGSTPCRGDVQSAGVADAGIDASLGGRFQHAPLGCIALVPAPVSELDVVVSLHEHLDGLCEVPTVLVPCLRIDEVTEVGLDVCGIDGAVPV